MPAQKQDKKKKARRTPIRVVKSTQGSKSNGRTAAKASSRKAQQRASVSKSVQAGRTTKKRRVAEKATIDMSQWSDLIKEENNRIDDRPARPSFLGAISTLRFTLAVLAIAAIFTLYVGHVYATQDLLAEVGQARRDNLTLRLKLNRTKGLYEAAIGPATIYQRAHALGLQEKVVSGPPIRITRE